LTPVALKRLRSAKNHSFFALDKVARSTRRSQGTVDGKGFAIAGVTVSGLILLFMIGVLVLLIATGAFKK
jgi:hypothetical protein